MYTRLTAFYAREAGTGTARDLSLGYRYTSQLAVLNSSEGAVPAIRQNLYYRALLGYVVWWVKMLKRRHDNNAACALCQASWPCIPL